MLDVILAIKFVHILAVAVMFGTWLCTALFMVFAYRSDNTSVVALTAVFVVRAELILMIPAIALQPLAGFPLAVAIGAPVSEYWIVVSSAIYAGIVAVWLANLVIEFRVRKISQEAALAAQVLPDSYRRLFRFWSLFAAAGLAATVAVMALMLWQPVWS
jgi:uncharacterized membrane protein